MTAKDAGAIAARAISVIALLWGLRSLAGSIQVLFIPESRSMPYLMSLFGSIALTLCFAWLLWIYSPKFYEAGSEESSGGALDAKSLLKVLLAAIGAFVLIGSVPEIIGLTMAKGSGVEELPIYDKPFNAQLTETVIRALAGLALVLFNVPLTGRGEGNAEAEGSAAV